MRILNLRARLMLCTTLAAAGFAPAMAQTTPGDQSGTATAAGSGQSAASATNAPAERSAANRASDTGNAGDIVVTARRVEERLQDVPISISVLSQQQIANRNIVNAGDIATYTPSLQVNPNFGTEYTSFAIRGFVQDPNTAPSVGVYFADVVAPRGPTQGTQAGDGAGPGNLFDLQNVQVLKGPQGTLFGRNTTGGAVLFVPQKPTGQFGGYVEGTYGNYDMHRLQGALNLPLSENARLRLSGDYMKRDGWLKNTTGIGPKSFNDIDYYSLRGSLVVDLTPDLENYTIVNYTHSNTNGTDKKLVACDPRSAAQTGATGIGALLPPLGQLLFCPALARLNASGAGFYGVQSDIANPRSRLDTWQIINTTTWRASDNLTLKNIASYGQLSVFQRTSLFGLDLQLGVPSRGIPTQRFDFTAISPYPGYRTVYQSTFTEEFQVQGNALDGRLTYQGGAYFERSLPLGRVGNQSNTLLPCTNLATLQCTDVIGAYYSSIVQSVVGVPVPISVGSSGPTIGRTSFRDVGIYSQATYSLTDQLKVTAGVRYTWDRAFNSSVRTSISAFPAPPFTAAPRVVCTDNTSAVSNGSNCGAVTRESSDKPTFLVDLDYKPIDDLLLYVKYTRGYRAGGLATNSPTSFRTFGPEKVDAYEGGLKATFRGAFSGTFNAAGFYNDFSNQQLQAGFTPAPGAPVTNTAGPVNAGKSRIYGAEVDTSISPFRGFFIDGSYTYLKTEIRSIASIVSTDPNYLVSYQIIPGDPLLLSPRNKYSATARYQLPLDDSIGQISLGATYSHTDHYLSTYYYRNNAVARGVYGDLGRIPGYNLLNLNIDWRGVAGTPVDVSLFATNVTKKHYYTYNAGLGVAGFEASTVGEPRFYGARVRYRFGG